MPKAGGTGAKDGGRVRAAAELLYAAAPEDFVSSRDALAREAKEAGDAAAAKEIGSLRKPTVPAFVVNVLVLEKRDGVASFVELGAALREATSSMSGPELRELSRQRHQLVAALVRQSRELALARGQRVGEDVLRAVEETLHAALATPEAAEQLLSGRLTSPLRTTGFAPGSDAPAAPRQSPEPTRPRPRRGGAKTGDDARRKALEEQLAAAWAAARDAADTRDHAERELDQALAGLAETEREATRLTREVERLQAELAEHEEQLEAAEHDQASAAETLKAARQHHKEAERAADAARRRVTALQNELDRT
jgi:hypothetical protein